LKTREGVQVIRASILVVCSSLALTACATSAPPASAPVPTASAATVTTPDKIWVTGSSNIRDFVCRAKRVDVSVEAAPEDIARTKSDGLPAVRGAALAVPVRSLDCGIGLQNAHLFEALGATEHPSISFILSDYAVERGDSVSAVRVQGLLRIGGTARPVVIHGSVFHNAAGQLILRGEREIDVRDFGITPPRRFFGILRVRKDVTVHFEVVVRPLIDPLGVLVSSLEY
jgi:polyisoprenoid-binding protein YceI